MLPHGLGDTTKWEGRETQNGRSDVKADKFIIFQNDVALTVIPEVSTFTLMLLSVGSVMVGRRYEGISRKGAIRKENQ